MPLPCWVTAEIGELKVNYSGHCYLELVEKGGDNGIPCARASAVVWRSQFGMISSYFKSETGTDLAPGMNVLMKVSVSYHELYGLSLVVSDIDPLYTLGDLERQRQKTVERLQEEGVFDMNGTLPFPLVPQRIAVVSSRNAAGFQDFINELGASHYVFRVELFDAFMQGHGTEDSVVDALGRICDRLEEFDAVVMIRGGGAQSDLAAFDSYRLCSHIAQFPLPVLTGIGHHKDESIADMVAAVSLKTPTAVAGFLVEALERVDGWLETAQGEVAQFALAILDEQRRTLREAAYKLSGMSASLTRTMDLKLERLSAAVGKAAAGHTAKSYYRLDSLERQLRGGAVSVLTGQKAKLGTYLSLAESRDPQKIISLGFAVVRSGGKAVSDASQITAGELLDIDMRGGRVAARVAEIKNKN